MGVSDFDEKLSAILAYGDDIGDQVALGCFETYVGEGYGLACRHWTTTAVHVGHPRVRHRDPAVPGDDFLAKDVQRGFAGSCAVRRKLVGAMGKRMSAQADIAAVTGNEIAPTTKADASASKAVFDLRYVAA
ncbi:hypothetical protein [Rhizobium leguminosarum]|uniref:hypothetical protein n=1 Tax=Rhizobium leguminosarum TaxID=384 RepID=UPI00143F7198|nr:hypothetical protein [Rhizobium leguminosarum]